MTKEQLNLFKEFSDWYENEDYREKVDKLNDSRDMYYLTADGIRTTDIEDVLDEIKWDDNNIGTLEGCIVVELHHIYGYVEALQIPCTVTVEKRYWDEEEKRFDCESYTIKDIEEW